MEILVVNTSLDWAARNPQFEDRRVTRFLTDHGHHAHDVPIPMVGAASSSALALGLLPYATYGDALLGLGHRAAFAIHPHKLVIVDEEVIDAFVGLGAEDHSLLSDSLEGCTELVATSESVAAFLEQHTSTAVDVIVDATGLLARLEQRR